MPLPLSLRLTAWLCALCSCYRYAIQLMIAKQLSEKLKEARLSQRRAESALADALETQQPDGTSGSGSASASSSSSSTNAATAGLAAGLGGRATEYGGPLSQQPLSSSIGAAPPAYDSAKAEVRALLERANRYERRIIGLEKDVERSQKEANDVKALLVTLGTVAFISLIALSDALPEGLRLPGSTTWSIKEVADQGYCLGLAMAKMDQFPN